ncbi:MAG: hypothetical protein HC915_03795 [Anaerolineae bacterium]|nr:hypothetical protein [Anaerolineae bacterium]
MKRGLSFLEWLMAATLSLMACFLLVALVDRVVAQAPEACGEDRLGNATLEPLLSNIPWVEAAWTDIRYQFPGGNSQGQWTVRHSGLTQQRLVRLFQQTPGRDAWLGYEMQPQWRAYDTCVNYLEMEPLRVEVDYLDAHGNTETAGFLLLHDAEHGEYFLGLIASATRVWCDSNGNYCATNHLLGFY